MQLLRKRDIPEEKYSNAFLGFGPEDSHFVVELTYSMSGVFHFFLIVLGGNLCTFNSVYSINLSYLGGSVRIAICCLSGLILHHSINFLVYSISPLSMFITMIHSLGRQMSRNDNEVLMN